MVQHMADNVGVVEALCEKTAIVVGHDWGSPIAAHSALLRPDVFTGVALLSVAYSPPGRRRPTESFAAMAAASGEEFYINYFQEPGRAEAEIEQDVRSWLLGFYFSASGDSGPPADGGNMANVPPGKQLCEVKASVAHRLRAVCAGSRSSRRQSGHGRAGSSGAAQCQVQIRYSRTAAPATRSAASVAAPAAS